MAQFKPKYLALTDRNAWHNLIRNIHYESHYVLVNYNNKEYYEKSLDSIRIRQEEIINDIKKLHDDAVSQIYIKISTSKPENYDAFIKFNIEAANKILDKIRNDFFVDNKRSRYNSVLIDNYDIRNLGSPNQEKLIDLKYDEEDNLQEIFEKIKENKTVQKVNSVTSFYYLDHHIKRFKVLSYLPFYFYNITHSFINELNKIKKKIEEIKSENLSIEKMKWSGKKTHIGFILGQLALEGYIDPPRSTNGEINYTAFAKLIKELFDVDVNVDTLRKYLNPGDEKFIENQNKFQKHQFSLPHVKEVT